MATIQLVPTPEEIEGFHNLRIRLPEQEHAKFDDFITALGSLILNGDAVVVGNGNITDNSELANQTAMHDGIRGSIIFGNVTVSTDEESDRQAKQPDSQRTVVENSILFGETLIFSSKIKGSVVEDSTVTNSGIYNSSIYSSVVTDGSQVLSRSNIAGSVLESSTIRDDSTVANSTIVSSTVSKSQIGGEKSHVQASEVISFEVLDSTLNGTKARGYAVKKEGKHTDKIVGSTLNNSDVQFGELTNVDATGTIFHNSKVKNLDFEDADLSEATAHGLVREKVPKPVITGHHPKKNISTSHSVGQPYLGVHISSR